MQDSLLSNNTNNNNNLDNINHKNNFETNTPSPLFQYPLAINACGHNEVFVGRIRRDYSVKSGINLWVVADNIRKGAATNAVQIIERLLCS